MTADKVPTGFTKVPNWVIEHPDLGRIDLVVYVNLARFADNKTRTCYPTHQTLMGWAKVRKKHTLITSLRRLEETGCIVMRKRDGFANEYYLPPTPFNA